MLQKLPKGNTSLQATRPHRCGAGAPPWRGSAPHPLPRRYPVRVPARCRSSMGPSLPIRATVCRNSVVGYRIPWVCVVVIHPWLCVGLYPTFFDIYRFYSHCVGLYPLLYRLVPFLFPYVPPLEPYQSVALGSKIPHQVLCASLDAKRIANKEMRILCARIALYIFARSNITELHHVNLL